MIRILGVDPGLSATGWGVLEIEDAGGVHLQWGAIRPAADALPQRLLVIQQSLDEVIRRGRPDVVAVERPFQHRNVKTAIALGQAQAAAMLAAAMHGLAVHEYPPRTVKEAVTGLGSADKAAVQQALVTRLGLAQLEASADAADALAVAYCHHLMHPVDLAAAR